MSYSVSLEHFLLLAAAAIVVAGAALPWAVRRWWLLVPVPAVLAGLAWQGWEFSSEATPFVAAVALLGYAGLGVGAVCRRAIRRR